MPTVRQRRTVASMFQGIANAQPPQRRQSGQLNSANDAHFDPIDGARKRNPFTLAGTAGLTVNNNDLLVINVHGARVFISPTTTGANVSAVNADGTPCIVVDNTHTGFSYFANATTAQLDYTVALDEIIITNRNTNVAATDMETYSTTLTVNKFSDLPPSTQNPGEPVVNGYYKVVVRENSDRSGFYKWDGSAYIKVPESGDTQAFFTLSTMPHRFIYSRTANTVTYDTLPLSSRESGSSRTNFILPIVGKPILSVNYFQSRLVFIAENSINLSKNSDIYTFFVYDMEDIVVTDRISKDILLPNVGKPLRSVVVGQTLLISCENAVVAFDANMGQDGLSNINGSLRSIADIKCIDVPLTSNGLQAFIPDTFNEIRGFGTIDPRIGTTLVASLNDYDPTILRDMTIKKMHSDGNTLYVLGTAGELFTHQSRVDNGAFSQLAWSEYTIAEHDFISLDSWQNVIRFVTKSNRNNYTLLEYIHHYPPVDSPATYRVRLDVRESQTGTYDAGKDETKFTHSYDDGSMEFTAIQKPSEEVWYTPKRIDGNNVYFEGKHSGSHYLGFRLNFFLTFSEVWDGSTDQRVMGSRFSIFFTDSTDADIEIGRSGGPKRKMHWTSSRMDKDKMDESVVQTGVYTTFIIGDLRYCDITVSSTTPGPLTVNAIGYVVNVKGVT